MAVSHLCSDEREFELRYESLFNQGRDYAFPCDADGQVDMNSLSERARQNYLYVRTLVGRDFSTERALALERHVVDQVLLEPFQRLALGEIIDLGRQDPGVDRPRH